FLKPDRLPSPGTATAEAMAYKGAQSHGAAQPLSPRRTAAPGRPDLSRGRRNRIRLQVSAEARCTEPGSEVLLAQAGSCAVRAVPPNCEGLIRKCPPHPNPLPRGARGLQMEA